MKMLLVMYVHTFYYTFHHAYRHKRPTWGATVCCSVLQCVAAFFLIMYTDTRGPREVQQCVAVCCNVLQCVAVFFSYYAYRHKRPTWGAIVLLFDRYFCWGLFFCKWIGLFMNVYIYTWGAIVLPLDRCFCWGLFFGMWIGLFICIYIYTIYVRCNCASCRSLCLLRSLFLILNRSLYVYEYKYKYIYMYIYIYIYIQK